MKQQTNIQTRLCSVVHTLNAEARTVDVIFASENPVRRYSWDDGHYDEILLCGPENLDLSRMDNMSLLDSHGSYSLNDRLGMVIPGSVRFEEGRIIATVKLSRRTKAEELFQDLQDGMSLPISVGYKIQQEERTETETSGVAVVRATKWQPMEISIVPIPADPAAKTRSQGNIEMSTPNNEQQHRPNNIINERTRISELRAMARIARIDENVLDEAIERGTSTAAFRDRVFDILVERDNKIPTFGAVTMGGQPSDIRSAMVDALMVRINSNHKPASHSREFVGLSLPELARRSLEVNGMSTSGISAGEVVQRALHTSSDFSHVITQTGQTVLAASYASIPSAVKSTARKTTAPDFKLKTTARLSGFSDLEKVNEHGEFKRGSFTEGAEGYKISTFGKVFGMTRQMIINDSLGAFADVSRELGLSAARLEADVLAKLINSNPAMSDGKSVFHNAHKNLSTSAGALSEATLSAARLAMSKQTGIAGEMMDVIPAYLVVAPELQTVAEKLLATIQPTREYDVNPFAGKLSLVVDTRLAAQPWYLVADANLVPSLEYAYLDGAEGPQFETQQGFDIDGVQIRVRVDFGAGWVDHRGWYMNPGR